MSCTLREKRKSTSNLYARTKTAKIKEGGTTTDEQVIHPQRTAKPLNETEDIQILGDIRLRRGEGVGSRKEVCPELAEG
jgi:hypothetical protein